MRCARVALLLAIIARPGLALAQTSEPPLQTIEIGRGTTTIIILHGGPGIPHSYPRPEWDRPGADFRVVYYDQRGCGMNLDAGPPYGWNSRCR